MSNWGKYLHHNQYLLDYSLPPPVLLCISPPLLFALFFILYIHFTQIAFFPCGRVASSHISFFFITLISSSIEFIHFLSRATSLILVGSQSANR